MAPTTDKLRRGIPVGGMSPSSDLKTGGANYFFTRLRSSVSAHSERGLVWSSKHVKRLDAISYDTDMYGATSGNTVLSSRRTGIEDWKHAARNGSNETIFKNSLSLFDGLDRIVVGSREEMKGVIDVFKKHGYTRFPDGRKLTDVIKVEK